MDIQIGRGKTARRAYGIDEIALVPGTRTLDPSLVDTSWRIGSIEREIPIIASAMDGVVDVRMAVLLCELGALGVLNLEGIQTRYADPKPILERISSSSGTEFVRLMQELYAEPIKPELIEERIQEIKGLGGMPQASAIADCAAARDDYYHETGNYVPVIGDGGLITGGDICKCIACGADGVMIGSPFARASEAPGRGYHWGMATPSPVLPRGTRIRVGTTGTCEQILRGPAQLDDGTHNLLGALKTSMGTLGAKDIKEMQQVEVVIAPSLLTEGKVYQKAQQIGMGK